jgi:hypothetical protein
MQATDPYTITESILYIENEFNEDLNNFIVVNYKYIVEAFRDHFHFNFIYLPYLIKDKHFKEVLLYNHPTVKIDKLDLIDLNLIYSGLISELNLKNTGSALVLFDALNTNSTDLIKPLYANNNLIEQFVYFAKESRQYTIDKSTRISKMMGLKISDEFSDTEKEIKYLFGESSDAILRLIEKREFAILNKLISLILVNTSILSRLRITSKSNKYRIYLVDYTGPDSTEVEIEMGALPKTLFIFYLNHPEGIRFKDLLDYEKELSDIYGKISSRNKEANFNAIKELVNPLSNSVNEQAAAIKKAFISKVSPIISGNYHITGVPRNAKVITLPRDQYVIREDNLQGL